jgi:hypothetical protein
MECMCWSTLCNQFIRKWVLSTINIDGITYHEMTSDQEVETTFSISIQNLLTLQIDSQLHNKYAMHCDS